MTIEMHLRIVGVLLIVLGAANVLLPRHFNWKRDMMAAPLLTRQVFWVHLAFLVLTLELFGWATLLCASALLEPGPGAGSHRRGHATSAPHFLQMRSLRPVSSNR